MSIEFLDELPGDPYEQRIARLRNNFPRQSSADLYEHAEALRANPMKWAQYPRPLKTGFSASRMSSAIREASIAAYDPRNGFQSASRQGNCYIRYNPDAVDPHKEAYERGVVDGRQQALEEVATVIWDFRQGIAKISGWATNNHLDSARKRIERADD